MSDTSIKLGIAVAARLNAVGQPIAPYQWALVAHPTNLSAPDATVFSIVATNAPPGWVKQISTSHVSKPFEPGTLGIVELAEGASMSIRTLKQLVNAIPAHRNNDNPSGQSGWSCLHWIIRTLHYLESKHFVQLPVHTPELSSRLHTRTAQLACRYRPWNSRDVFAMDL